MAFTAEPLDGAFGCAVRGLDLDRPIEPEDAASLRELWLEHGLIVFRAIGRSSEAQLALSRCFGELEPHPIPRFCHPDHPELIVLSNEDGPSGPVYDFGEGPTTQMIPWHTDLAFATTPNAGALLRMVQRPATGGQTGWLDTAAAYDALDRATKDEIDALEAVYLFCAGLEDMRFNRPEGQRLTPRKDSYPDFPPVVNPLVWTHPETGRRVLNISTLNIDHIVGRRGADGDALIRRLIDHALDPRFRYVHDWANGDMVLWDNRRTMHMAFGHPADQIRIVHRTTIRGTHAMGRHARPEEIEA